MKNKLPDTIEISWHIDDVKMQAQNDGYDLTNDEAREILQDLKINHDATQGINWDVIQVYIQNYKGDN